ncbi:MAG: DNA-binding GntR family transcriptional regulator [Paracoccaceae bacterium]|jgi:DNA-binding GntR family transcriptional regulator
MTEHRRAARTQTLHALLARQIMDHVRDRQVPAGAHLSAQELADELGVSRSPILQALRLLAEQGLARHAPRRGFFLTEAPDAAPLSSPARDAGADAYFRIAEDRLSGALPDTVSEALLRERYALSQAELQSLLTRMVREGWIERRKGYGWRFSAVLTTADALVQTYRLRAALEPAALLEPTFSIDGATLDRLAAIEKRLLDGEIETASSDALYDRGVAFHETLARASGNPWMFDALHRVNQVRRLLAYRSMGDRQRYYKQCAEHLEIIDLIRRGRNDEAAVAMRHHLGTVIVNLQEIAPLLTGGPGR